MTLVRLIYYSEFKINPENGPIFSQINWLLDTSERNNANNHITGALIFDSKWFVQLLEGMLKDVREVYDRIEHDPRHANINFVEMLAVPSRRFGNWRMACAERIGPSADVFAPYLYDGRFEPAYMASGLILSLMEDLSVKDFGRPTAPALPSA